MLSLLNNGVLGEDPFYIETTSVGAGTGNYNSFLRLQAGGTEEGYNTDTNNQADNKNGIWTHSLKLSDMSILTIDGKTYYEVRLDVNEDNTTAGTPITLDELWIMGSAAAATGANFSDDNNYANDFAGFHRVFDLNGTVALQDVNEGSGTDDYRILIPTTAFDPGDVYFTLYSRFTGADGGFEEWRVLGSDGGTTEPPPAITVDKVANVTTIAEGTPTDVIFTYTLTSQSAASDPLRLDTLVDDSATALNLADDVNLLTGFVFGSNYGTYYVSGDGDGDYLLDSTETWTFRYTADDMVLDAGDTRTNVVTVVAHDNEATQVTDSDNASVTGTDVLPAISLVKTANPTSISEGTATNVVYTYAVSSQSKSTDPILLTSFVDDAGTPGLANAGDDVNLLAGFVFGSNHGTYYVSGDADGDYLLDSTEVWNFSYTASNVVKDVSDSPWTNIAVVKGTDDEGNEATAQDDASVTVTDVLPDVAIVKTASTNEVQAGALTSVTFTYAITNESTVSTDPLTIVTLIDDNGTPLDDLDDKDLSALYVSGDNGNGLLDVGETWIYQWTTDILLMPGESYTNIACVSVTDDEGNPVGACDDETIISSVNQAYTPGFWSNNASPIWDGSESTYAKSGGLGLVIGASKNNAPDGVYKDLLYVLHDSNADGTADGSQSGFLMIGDWNRNGVADDGNNVLIVGHDYALSLLNASTKEQQDGRYQVARDVVASWLNYVSGSYVGDADKADGFNTTADYIQEAVDWLIATTSGDEILAANELKNTAKVGMTSNAWQLGVDTGGTAAFELLAGSTIHANLDYFNNNGYILP
ncbi:hypothetical protein [Tsuneonella sp. HG222]